MSGLHGKVQEFVWALVSYKINEQGWQEFSSSEYFSGNASLQIKVFLFSCLTQWIRDLGCALSQQRVHPKHSPHPHCATGTLLHCPLPAPFIFSTLTVNAFTMGRVSTPGPATLSVPFPICSQVFHEKPGPSCQLECCWTKTWGMEVEADLWGKGFSEVNMGWLVTSQRLAKDLPDNRRYGWSWDPRLSDPVTAA